MTHDPRAEANEYIANKRVDTLFQELGTRLCYERAEDPNAFLIKVLEEMKANKAAAQLTLFFTKEDVETLFDMFDPMGKGSISGSQYRAALEAINVENPIASVPSVECSKAEFMKNMMEEVKNLSMS